MTLLSEIYDVTLKHGNRGASSLGYYRPTLSEFFMTDHDFKHITKPVILRHVDSATMLDIESSFAITTGETNNRALAFDGTNLISAGYSNDFIYIHQGLTSAVSYSIPSPATYTYSMCFNSFTGDLLVTDNNTDRLYVVDILTGSVKSSFALPADDTEAIALDNLGNLLWFGKLGTSFTVFNGISSSILYTLNFGTAYNYIGDIAFDGRNLIMVSRSTDTLYVFDGISTNLMYSKALTAGTYIAVTWTGNRIVTANSNTDLIYLHKTE